MRWDCRHSRSVGWRKEGKGEAWAPLDQDFHFVSLSFALEGLVGLVGSGEERGEDWGVSSLLECASGPFLGRLSTVLCSGASLALEDRFRPALGLAFRAPLTAD